MYMYVCMYIYICCIHWPGPSPSKPIARAGMHSRGASNEIGLQSTNKEFSVHCTQYIYVYIYAHIHIHIHTFNLKLFIYAYQ